MFNDLYEWGYKSTNFYGLAGKLGVLLLLSLF